MSRVERSTTPWGEHQLDRFWDATDSWAALVIVHGLCEHSGRYEQVGQSLAGKGIAVAAFDLEGHGGSGGPRAHVIDWSRYLAQVEEALARARIAGLPLVLLGHSYGGLIAYEYAQTGRSPVPSMLILSTPALGGGAAWQRTVAPIAARLVPRLALPTAFADGLSRDPEVGRAYLSDPLVETKATARLGNELFEAMKRVREGSAPPVPTLVTHGGSDPIVPPQSTAYLADYDNVDRILYPKLRHEILNEPEGPEVLADMIDWMANQVGHPAGG